MSMHRDQVDKVMGWVIVVLTVSWFSFIVYMIATWPVKGCLAWWMM